MKKIFAFVIMTIVSAGVGLADERYPKGTSPQEVGDHLVNKFLQTPHTRFGNPHADKAPNYITYPDALMWLGALWYAEKTHNAEMSRALVKRFEPLFSTERHLIPKMNHVDHNVVGAVPLEIYAQHLGGEEYRKLGMQYADTQWQLPDDAKPEQKAYADKGYSWQTRLWIDDMFMITTVQAQAYKVTGDKKYINRAAEEMVLYLNAIQEPNGLFYHAPDVPFYWARGNGWMAAGMAELLSVLPDDNPNRLVIMAAYLKMMEQLRALQGTDGLWRQLLDDEEAWSETSGSAMFCYAMATGIKKGWLSREAYAPAVRRGWQGLVGSFNEDGELKDVCEGTNKRNDRQYYLDRKRISGDLHAHAPMLWLATVLLDIPEFIDIESGDLKLMLMVGTDGRLYQLGFGDASSEVTVPQKMPARELEFLPCYGNGYVAQSAVMATHTDGNTSTDLMFVSKQTEESPDGTTHTVLFLKDPVYPFFVDVHFKCYPESSIMEMWTVLRHDERGGDVILSQYASASPWLRSSQYWLTQFNGRYKHEATMEEERLGTGVKILNSNLGVRAHYYGIPSVILSLGKPAQEDEGDVFAASLKWPGSYQMAFDLNWSRNLRVMTGINPQGAPYHLERGERFETPAVVWCYSKQGKGELSRRMHRWANAYVVRDSDKDRPVLLNNWEATHCQFDEQRLFGLFGEAKSIGAELFLLDDGWFGNGSYARNDDKHGLGDWEPDSTKLPHGIGYLTRMAAKKNIGFGIWLEPEMVNPQSRLYQQHPEWIITQQGREPILGRHQEILDLTRPEVQHFEREIFRRTLKENPGIRYVKWDCNRYVTQPGSTYLPSQKQGHLLIDYNKSLYSLMEHFATTYPDVMAMLCAGGSGRVDYGSMRYFHSFWPSDNTDPIDRIKIQWGFSHFFPANTISAHVTRMGKRHIKLAVDVALSGAFGIDLALDKATKEECAQLAAGVELYKKRLRPLVMHGDLYRLLSPYDHATASLSYVAADRSHAVVYVYQVEDGDACTVRLKGLDAEKRYRLQELNLPIGGTSRFSVETKTGRQWMEEGVRSPLCEKYESAVLELVEETGNGK